MSATKLHAEALTEQHKLYSLGDFRERTYYRYAVLDCAAMLLSHAIASADDAERETLHEVVDLIHTFYDEVKAVDNWQPAK